MRLPRLTPSRISATRRLIAAAAVAALSTGLLPPSVSAEPSAPSPAAPSVAARRLGPQTAPVLAISLDGFNPTALKALGVSRTPTLHKLIAEGATTLNARAQVEQTVTLPNHTSMVTSRRIDKSHGGHGVTWNDDNRPKSTVQQAAGHPVDSIFSVVHKAGGSSAVFSTKAKFSLFQRSWPSGVNSLVIKENDDAGLVRAVRADLVSAGRAFTFLHLGAPDAAGHAFGFMSPRYLRAVAKVDRLLGTIMTTISATPSLADLRIVLTADHGGKGRKNGGHGDPTKLFSYRIPFMVWGPGITHGDLYALNPTYLKPGSKRIGYAGKQPIRNGDLANFTAHLLGLGPVPGSREGSAQTLTASVS